MTLAPLFALVSSFALSEAHAGGLLVQGEISGSWGWEHPAAIVGFNPQPEPPGDRYLSADLTHATAPLASLDGVRDGALDILFGLGVAEAPIREVRLPADACDARADVVLWPSTGDVALPPGPCAEGRLSLEARLADGSVLPVELRIVGDDGTSPASIVASAPDTAAAGAPASTVLSVRFASGRVSAADVTVSIVDPRSGDAIALQ